MAEAVVKQGASCLIITRYLIKAELKYQYPCNHYPWLSESLHKMIFYSYTCRARLARFLQDGF